jgi:hypothetical protein
MKLITSWGVRSRRLDQLLERDCPHCGGSAGRLVWHLAGPDPDNIQVWLSCARCGSKLGNAQPHLEHRRMSSYPIWREGLGEDPTSEETEEIVLAAKPVRLVELLREIPGAPCLEHVRREFSANGTVVGFGLVESDLAELAPVVGLGKYAALEFRDTGARLLKFECDLVRILTPHRKGDRLDLSDRTTLRITWREPSP